MGLPSSLFELRSNALDASEKNQVVKDTMNEGDSHDHKFLLSPGSCAAYPSGLAYGHVN
jgi:hypothetical protein